MKKWLLSARSFKNAHNFQSAFGGTLWDYQHQTVFQQCQKMLQGLVSFWVFFGSSRSPHNNRQRSPDLGFSASKSTTDGWSRSQMNRGSRLQCPTKVDGWNSHDLQGDICDVTAKLMAGKVAVFSLCKHFSGPKFLLSCKFSITSSHHLLFKKKSAHFPSPEVLCHTNRRTGGFRL